MTRSLGNLLAWGGFGLLVWAAWLAFPKAPGSEPGPALHAVLVDASASAVRRRPGWSGRVREIVREEEKAAHDAGEELAVVLFGRDVLRLKGEKPSAEIGWLEAAFADASFGAGTELERAIASVQDQLTDPSRDPGSLVLIGDGHWTGVNPAQRISRLARQGVFCKRVGIGDPRWPDLGVLDVRLPMSLNSGESLAVVCDLMYLPGSREVSGELLIQCEDAGGARAVIEPLALPAGGGEWSVSVDLGPCLDGEISVSARVSLVGEGALSLGDPVRENDIARGKTRAGEIRLGLASSEPGREGELRTWLQRSGGIGIQWLVVPPEAVGEELAGRDLFVSYDVSTARLPDEWLGPFLQGGGGWLAVGGWGLISEFWPTGTKGSAPASDLLPLVPAQSEDPQREVIFCIDGSGSMAGPPFESVRSALVELVQAALPTDELQMRFFTGALGPVIDVGGGGRSDRVQGLRELLDVRVPGGSTDILSSLEALAESREESDVPGLVLLLSDGRDDNAFQIPERTALLKSSFAESNTRLSVVGIGAEADLDILAALAGSQEDVVVVDELAKLAELFRREVARERVREGSPVGVTVHGDTSSEDLRALTMAWRERTQWPEVEQVARTEARPGAEVILRTAEGLPLLGFSRVGEGWSACFPALLEAGWAPGYQSAGDVWGPLWSLLGREAGDEVGLPSLTTRGDELLLTLGQAGKSWPAIVHLELYGRGPGGSERLIVSGEVALGAGSVPGALERRSGPLSSMDCRGDERLRAILSDPESGAELAVLGLEMPLHPEFQHFFGPPLGLGVLGPERLPQSRRGLPAPDERAPYALLGAIALLACAALLGRWRAG